MRELEVGNVVKLKEKVKKKTVVFSWEVEDVGTNFVRLVRLDEYLRPTDRRALLSKQTVSKTSVA